MLCSRYLAPRLDWYLRREQVMWLAVPTGIVIHKLFKIDTLLNRMMFGPDANRAAQAVVSLMVFKGLVVIHKLIGLETPLNKMVLGPDTN